MTHRSPYITARQLAAELGVSVSTINRLAADGRISHLQVGTTRRFNPDDVLAELYVAATPAPEPRAKARAGWHPSRRRVADLHRFRAVGVEGAPQEAPRAVTGGVQ